MKKVDCYNCGSDKSTFYANENGFNLVKCNECGLLFVNPRPTDKEIKESHKLGVHSGTKKIDANVTFKQNSVINYQKVLIDIFENGNVLNEKTWLDIGCGNGEFLIALKRFSKGQIIAKGIEPNIHKQKAAQKRGVDVSFFDLDKHTNKYDVISFLNVYSHLPNPVTSILSWKKLLNSGGELLLQTGDTANFNSKDHARPFSLPNHLSFASESIVTDILERTGFEVLSVNKYPFFHNLNLIKIIKEILKFFWPNKTSRIKYIMRYKIYTKSDMYVRAKLKSV